MSRAVILGRCVAAVLVGALCFLPPLAHAAAQSLPLFVERSVDGALINAIQAFGADPQLLPNERSVLQSGCALAPTNTPRLVLLTRAASAAELDRCRETAKAEVIAVAVGWQAVAIAVPVSSPVWSMQPDSLFRALGQNSLDKRESRTWNAIDPTYPALPIGVLLPPPDSVAWHLFDRLIMQAGCARSGEADLPLNVSERASFCGTVRSDIPVARRKGSEQELLDWAAKAAPGQIAIVTLPELQQLDRRAVALLIGGVLPTLATIQNGRYAAAQAITLMIVLPRAVDPGSRTRTRSALLDLLSEASIAPGGALAAAGLIPAPPSERVAARTQAADLLQQR
jgi:phosphate transport system substrate-binding protein